MSPKPSLHSATDLLAQWSLSAAATLGSSVRAKGILLELRARLAPAIKKSLDLNGAVIVLRMPDTAQDAFQAAFATVAQALTGIESLPVIPREIEDILGISTTERHRWLKDGRLTSIGTRTVKLRGRARQITFHVFDPRRVEDVMNDDLVSAWREDDVLAAAENRRRAAWKAKLTRAQKDPGRVPSATASSEKDAANPGLIGWEEFARDGLLR